MATNRWLGSAPAISQVDTFTIGGSPTIGDTVSITIGAQTITYTVTATDTGAASPVDSVAANFQALLTSTTAGMFQDEQWTSTGSSAVITATATNAGVPVSYTTADTGATTITGANVTPSSGPNDASIAANWSRNAVPTTGDNVLIDITGASDILYGLSSIGSIATFTVLASYQGNIGLPFLNSSNTNSYVEYRTRFFPVPSTVVIAIGEGTGQGPTRVYINNGSVLAATIFATGNSSVTNVPTVNIIGCSSGVLTVQSGSVGLASDDNTTSATVTTGNISTGATLTVGSGATVTTLNQTDGITVAYGAVPTLNINSGIATLYATNVTAITAKTGSTVTVFWLGTGTLSTATFEAQSENTFPTLDLSLNPSSRTITNATFIGGAAINDPAKTSTWSNAFAFDQSSWNNSTVGRTFNVLRS